MVTILAISHLIAYIPRILHRIPLRHFQRFLSLTCRVNHELRALARVVYHTTLG